jgi:hypothetical protein
MEYCERQPDLTFQIPGDIFDHVAQTLCAALPPSVSDSPEDRLRRDNTAVAQVAALLPANADEAGLAAMHVLACALSRDWLRLARKSFNDPGLTVKYNARSASMMRQALDFHSLLMCVQAQRRKREANPAASEQAAKLERALIRLMTGALKREVPAPVEKPSQVSTPAD